MHVLLALTATGLVFGWMILLVLLNASSLAWWTLVATAVWAGWLSYSSRMYRYKTGLPENPIGVALAVVMLWLVGFPWFIVAWLKVREGKAEARVREEPRGGAVVARGAAVAR